MPEKLPFVNKKDPLIILGLLVAAFGVWAFFFADTLKDNTFAEIYYDGSLVKTVGLEEAGVFSVDAMPSVVFEVKDGAVAFISSDCPDQICVHAGRLRDPGQFAACLPNKVTLWVGGEDSGGVDIVAR